MLIINHHGYENRYAYGGSGIFESIANVVERVFSSTAAKTLGNVSSNLVKEGAKKALQVGQKAALDAGTTLVKKGVTQLLAPKSHVTLNKYANPTQRVDHRVATLNPKSQAILAKYANLAPSGVQRSSHVITLIT